MAQKTKKKVSKKKNALQSEFPSILYTHRHGVNVYSFSTTKKRDTALKTLEKSLEQDENLETFDLTIDEPVL